MVAIRLAFRRGWLETPFWAIGAMILASFFVAGPGAAWLGAVFGPRGNATADSPR
jgi:hypothetical protein